MKRLKRSGEILLLCCALVLLMGADAQQARFERLGSKIMCTCGCGELLLKCNHVGCPNSDRMIRELHAQVSSQPDDEQVLQWFRTNWGVTAVVEPATHGFELLAWILPPAVALLFFGLLVYIVMAWRKRARVAAASATPAKPDPHLEALRARARQETEI